MNQLPYRNLQKKNGLRTIIAGLLVGGSLIVIAGYTAAKTKTIIAGPSLEVHYPKNGMTVHEELVPVIGRVLNVSSIRLGGRPIYTDEHGYFEEKLLLPYGYSILELTATDRFDREVKKKIELVHK